MSHLLPKTEYAYLRTDIWFLLEIIKLRLGRKLQNKGVHQLLLPLLRGGFKKEIMEFSIKLDGLVLDDTVFH